MRISEIFIDGFGHYRDKRIGPFASPVVVLYGTNEAGKSTLLEFVSVGCQHKWDRLLMERIG